MFGISIIKTKTCLVSNKTTNLFKNKIKVNNDAGESVCVGRGRWRVGKERPRNSRERDGGKIIQKHICLVVSKWTPTIDGGCYLSGQWLPLSSRWSSHGSGLFYIGLLGYRTRKGKQKFVAGPCGFWILVFSFPFFLLMETL